METLKISSLSAGQVPKVLADYISPGEWATFHVNMTKAKQEICMKAVCVELGLCFGFGLFCSFCCHSYIEDIMDSGKVDGYVNHLREPLYKENLFS
jgi:hypothetical protein